MATKALQHVAKASVKLAAFEPSSVLAKDFVAVAQSPKVKKNCPALELKVKVLDPAKLTADYIKSDKKQSTVHLTFGDKSEKTFDTTWSMQELLKACVDHADEREIAIVK